MFFVAERDKSRKELERLKVLFCISAMEVNINIQKLITILPLGTCITLVWGQVEWGKINNFLTINIDYFRNHKMISSEVKMLLLNCL